MQGPSGDRILVNCQLLRALYGQAPSFMSFYFIESYRNDPYEGDVAAVGVDEPDGGQVDEVISQSREKEQAGRNTIQHRIAK